MRQNTTKFQYKQLETYKEILELRHIKIKTLIVNIINIVFAVISSFLMFRLGIDRNIALGVIFMFVVIFTVNFALYSYDNDQYNNLKLAMYVNTIAEYVIAVTLIIIFQTPSIFTSLFLAYAISSIYQDYKVMLVSNFSLFITGFLLVISFGDLFEIAGNTSVQNNYVVIILVAFVLLLTLSSYILIKRKMFFYNQLAHIKESEVRNINLLMDIEKRRDRKSLNSKEYYSSIGNFSKEISKKIGIENIFNRKVRLLKDLKKYSLSEIVEKYPEYNQKQIEQIRLLELETHLKMRNLSIKASKTQNVEVSKKEIFSESQFKSFKHFNDHIYVKIISFVVFYCLVKIDKPYLKEFSEEDIKDILFNSEYYYKIDSEVMDVYLQNSEVFDTIVNDLLKGNWHYEKDN